MLRQAAFWEALVWFVLCASWIWFVSLGEENGFGYFHQPQNDITIPLIVGGIINAATFWAHAFYAMPRLLKAGKWAPYSAAVAGLLAGNVALQTMTQSAIISLGEPTLRHVTTWELAVENSYLPPFVLVLSALYRFARDWTGHLREKRALEHRAAALEHALRTASDGSGDFLLIGAGRERLQIPLGTIKYLKAAGNYIEIVTTGSTHLAYGALKNVVGALPVRRFARVHRSYIVGLDHVSAIKGDVVEMQSEQLPIGAAHKAAFLAQWEERRAARR